jgi:hypothetical protein
MSQDNNKPSDLHSAIMNLPCATVAGWGSIVKAYQNGHRDARHAAAELVANAEADAASRCRVQGGNTSDEPFAYYYPDDMGAFVIGPGGRVPASALPLYTRASQPAQATTESAEREPWYCPHCKTGVPPQNVTFEESHDPRAGGCGYRVGEWPAATEKAGVPEGWREFMEFCATTHGKEVNGNGLSFRAKQLLAATTVASAPAPAEIEPTEMMARWPDARAFIEAHPESYFESNEPVPRQHLAYAIDLLEEALGAAPAEAEPSTSVPSVAGIDTPEFRALLRAWWDASTSELSSARAALIAHIDAHCARQDQAAPTDLSKRLRAIADSVTGNNPAMVTPKCLADAADEIERYYGGMMNWKRTAEAKDREFAATQAAPADVRDAAYEQSARMIETAFFGDPAWPKVREVSAAIRALRSPQAGTEKGGA